MSAGYGYEYHRQLFVLEKGDIFLAFVTGHGYVGVGKVTSRAEPINSFKIKHQSNQFHGKTLREIPKNLCKTNLLKWSNDSELCEYIVGVEWIYKIAWDCNEQTKEAIWEKNTFFSTEHIVCSMEGQQYTVDKVFDYFKL